MADKPKGKPTTEHIAEFMRMALVHLYEQIDSGFEGEAFKAGASLAIEEVSVRLIGEFFDTYHERIKAFLYQESVSVLAKEFEVALDEQVLSGDCDLHIDVNGTKRYSPHPRRQT